jgi:hypothetical protein
MEHPVYDAGLLKRAVRKIYGFLSLPGCAVGSMKANITST